MSAVGVWERMGAGGNEGGVGGRVASGGTSPAFDCFAVERWVTSVGDLKRPAAFITFAILGLVG